MPKVKRRIKKKVCPFHETNTVPYYRDVDVLSRFMSERKKIFPAIYTGVCAKHQRQLAQVIKQARHLALLPFVGKI